MLQEICVFLVRRAKNEYFDMLVIKRLLIAKLEDYKTFWKTIRPFLQIKELMRHFARFGTICTILKQRKTPMEKSFFSKVAGWSLQRY